MSHEDVIKSLLGIQDVTVTDLEENETDIYIHLQLEREPHACPCCSELTDTIHDYRLQKVRDIELRGKHCFLMFRKRRYRCTKCGKRFFEWNSVLPRYQRMTSRMSYHIIDLLRDSYSYKTVSNMTGVSSYTVMRRFDMVSFSAGKLPRVLGIDEFRGNTEKEKFQVILTDIENGEVIDILPSRITTALINYFSNFSKEERAKVEYFVCDMYYPYKDIQENLFKKSILVVDRYHWIRQAIWAMENVRKRIQNKYSKKYRLLFKHSKRLLIAPFDSLSKDEKEQCRALLRFSPELEQAHDLKERIYTEILTSKTKEQCRERLARWIYEAELTGLKEFKACITAYRNWLDPICESVIVKYSNAFTEGCNNKIKVLKRNAYGYKRFHRFRNRILFIFRNGYQIKKAS